MTAPLVSTIIMTRRPAFVAGAIAMMRAQTYPNVEVVLGLHGLRAAELPAKGRKRSPRPTGFWSCRDHSRSARA
jgi:hypothetical protein